jgi:ribosome maturation protein Sdo1
MMTNELEKKIEEIIFEARLDAIRFPNDQTNPTMFVEAIKSLIESEKRLAVKEALEYLEEARSYLKDYQKIIDADEQEDFDWFLERLDQLIKEKIK